MTTLVHLMSERQQQQITEILCVGDTNPALFEALAFGPAAESMTLAEGAQIARLWLRNHPCRDD